MSKKRLIGIFLVLTLVLTFVFTATSCLPKSPNEPTLKIVNVEMKGTLKTSYYVGEELNFGDAYLQVAYNDGSFEKVDITADMVSGFNSQNPGDYILTVSYQGFNFEYHIIVEAVFTDNTHNLLYLIDDNKAVIVGYNKNFNSNRFTVPESVGGYPVKAIGDNAFKNNSVIVILSVPYYVEEIGANAFSGCQKLDSVEISASTVFDGGGFKDCINLNEVIFSIDNDNELFSSVPDEMFYGCSKLKTIKLYNKLTATETGLNLPETVASIGNSAFENCSSLTSFKFPSSLSVIGNYAFKNTALSDIELKGGLRGTSEDGFAIGSFSYISALQNVTFSDDNHDFSNLKAPFQGCSSLSSLILPDDCVIITGAETDSFLYGLENLRHFGASFVDYTVSDYFGTRLIDNINIYASGSSVSDSAFADMPNLENVIFSDTTNGTLSGKVKVYIRNISGNIDFGSYAFKNCNNLNNIEFPSQIILSSANEGVFNGCSSLTSFSAQFADTVTEIGDFYLKDCSLLSQFNFEGGSNIAQIGKEVFTGTVLNRVDLSNLSSLEIIGESAFKSITTFSSSDTFSFPNSLTAIHDYAFSDTNILSFVSDTVTSLGEGVFENSNQLNSVSFASLNSIGAKAFRNTSLSSFDFSNIETIGDFAFENTKFLSLELVDGINTGTDIFRNCSLLTTVDMGSLTSDIWQNAFSGCANINTFSADLSSRTLLSFFGETQNFANGVTVIVTGNSVFENCFKDLNVVSLASFSDSETVQNSANEIIVRLKNTVISINASAFENTEINDISTLPETVVFIGDYAFKNTLILEINNSLTNITDSGVGIFENCLNLTSVTLNDFASKNPQNLFMTSAFKGAVNITYFEAYFNSSNAGGYTFNHYFGTDFHPSADMEIKVSGSSVCENAFENNTYVTSVIAVDNSSGVQNLSSALSGTVSIEINLNNVTSLGNNAFKNCSNLADANFEKVTAFGNAVLYGCLSLFDLRINLSDSTFNHVFAFDGEFDAYSFENKLYVTTVGSAISQGAFKDIGSLRYAGQIDGQLIQNILNADNVDCGIYLNMNSVSKINDEAFVNSGIAEIYLSSNVTSVGSDILKGTVSLKTMTAPFNVKKITDTGTLDTFTDIPLSYYFGDNSSVSANKVNLTSLTVLNGLTSLQKNFFYYNSSGEIYGSYPLESLYILHEKEIGSNSDFNLVPGALKNLTSLKTLEAPFTGTIYSESVNFTLYDYFENIVTSTQTIALETLIIREGLTEFTIDIFNDPSDTGSQLYIALQNKLQEVVLPGSLEIIGSATEEQNIFSAMNNLQNIELSHGIKTIGIGVFKNCSNLVNVNIPSSVTTICSAAFQNCQNLTTVVFDKFSSGASSNFNITSIGDKAFYNDLKLASVYETTNNGTLSSLSDTQDEGQNSLNSVPSSVSQIGAQAFYNTALINFLLPDSLSSLGEGAFENSSLLTSVYFNSQIMLTEIPKNAFLNCSQLSVFAELLSNAQVQDNNFPSRVSTIKDSAFKNTGNLNSFVFGTQVTSIETNAFSGAFVKPSNLENAQFIIDLKSDALTIGANAFNNCSNVKEIILNVSSDSGISSNAFAGCYNIESFTAPFNSKTLGDYFNVAVSSSSSQLLSATDLYSQYNKLTDIVVKSSSVTSKAFAGCSSVRFIDISAVTANNGIGAYAFANCSSLIGNTQQDSGSNYFSVPDVLTSIPEYAFYKCSSLTEIKFGQGSNVSAFYGYAFYGCSSLTKFSIISGIATSYSAELPSKLTTLSDYSLAKNAFSTVNLSNVTSIGNFVFSDNLSLTSFELSHGITSIGDKIINGCTNIEELTAPFTELSLLSENNATSGSNVNKSYFKSGSMSTKITTVNIISFGNSKFIKSEALKGNTTVTTVTIDSDIEVINYGAFENCISLEKVLYGGSSQADSKLRTIDYNAFKNCYNLKYFAPASSQIGVSTEGFIDLSATVSGYAISSIGANAFNLDADNDKGTNNFENIKKITFHSEILSIGNFAFANIKGVEKIEFKGEGASEFSIGTNAFSNINNLKKVVTLTGTDTVSEVLKFPDNLVSIGDSAFENAVCVADNAAIEFNLSQNTDQLGNNVFKGCTLLSKLVINAVSSAGFGTGLISGANSLIELTAPFNTMTLADYYGEDVDEITSQNLSDMITTLNGKTFNVQKITTLGNVVCAAAFIGLDAVGAEVTIGGSNSKVTLNNFIFAGSSIKKLTLETNINAYSPYMFYNCVNLENIIFPQGMNLAVESVGEYAFYSCQSLNKITLPYSITSIGQFAFYGCSKITSLEKQGDYNFAYTFIGQSAFEGCSSLTTVYLGGVTEIGANTFKGTALTSFDLTNVVTIGAGAFESAIKLNKHPSGYKLMLTSATNIDNNAFKNCDGITEIIFSKSNITLGTGVLSGCSSLQKLTADFSDKILTNYFVSGDTSSIPNSLIEIILIGNSVKASAFEGCSSLTTVNLGSVTEIGASAFKGTALTSVDLTNVETVGASAFANIDSLSISNTCLQNIVNIGEKAFYETAIQLTVNSAEETNDNGTGDGGNSEPNQNTIIYLNLTSLTSLGNQAFYKSFVRGEQNSAYSIRLILPAALSLATFGSLAFAECTAITQLEIAVTGSTNSINFGLSSDENYIFKNCTNLIKLIAPFDTKNLQGSSSAYFTSVAHFTEFEITSTNVKNQAFYQYQPSGFSLYGTKFTVVFQDNSTIGWSAFQGSAILNLTLTGNVNLDYSSFEGSSIESINISGSNLNIEDRSFRNCTDLKTVVLDSQNITIFNSGAANYSQIFDGCSEIADFTADFSVYKLSDYLTLSSAVSASGEEGNPNLINITIVGASVINDAFKDIDLLGTVTLENTVQSIGNNAFNGSNITSINLSSVSSLGTSVFENCDRLTSVNFGDNSSLTNISSNAFYNAVKLSKVLYYDSVSQTDKKFGLPSSVKNIGEHAFRNTKLQSAINFENIESIGNYAFNNAFNSTENGNETATTNESSNFTLQFNSITSLGKDAFSNNNLIKTVVFNLTQTTLNYLGDNAFLNCTALASVTLQGSIQIIGYNSFEGCTSLTSINLPSSITEIKNNAFKGCKYLSDLTFNSALTLGTGVFEGVHSFTQIKINVNADLTLTDVPFEGLSYKCTIYLPCLTKYPSDYIGELAQYGEKLPLLYIINLSPNAQLKSELAVFGEEKYKGNYTVTNSSNSIVNE